tara:strand:+ start:399 stop:2465 length:2067 start_codon:yes stop_codon:yes gene_type:complete
MSYTVDTTNTKIVQDASSTDTDLSGLASLTDGTNSIVTVSGGTQGGVSGSQTIYTILHPYRFQISGTQTISPEEEMLITNNTTFVENSNDLRVMNSGTLIINGKITESWGTWYSRACWFRANRVENDSFRDSHGPMTFEHGATVTWEGGVCGPIDGPVGIRGSNPATDGLKLISNATLTNLGGAMFAVNSSANASLVNFSLIGNRLFDDRPNSTTTGYKATNSLIEGGDGQTFIDYSGNTEYATWNRSQKVRTFTNSEYGMVLPVSSFGSNAHQRGGQVTIRKSGTLTVVDVDKNPLNTAKVSIRTYDDNTRLDYSTLSYATDKVRADYTDQTAVVNLTGTVNTNAEFAFDQIIKQITDESTFALGLSNVGGTFSRGDNLQFTNNKTGLVTYWDSSASKIYYQATNNGYPSAGHQVANLTQTGSGTVTTDRNFPTVPQAHTRFTKGASDAAQVVDVVTISYLQGIDTVELDYAGIGAFVGNVFKLPDLSLTNLNQTQVAAYSELENTNKLYDYFLHYLYTNWNQEDTTICSFVGEYLDFGANNIVLDTTTGVAPISKNGTTYTINIGSSRFAGNLKTTGTISQINGALTAGLLNANGVITYPDRLVTLNNVVVGSRVYIFDTTNNVEVANLIATATTSENYIASDGTDAQLLIKVRNASNAIKYKQFRSTATLVAAGVTIQINQPLDQ